MLRVDKITVDHRCGFWHNKSTNHILENKCECIGRIYQLFIDFKKAYDSVRRVVLYMILTEFGIPMRLVRLIKLCLNDVYISLCS
jgi:sorting nexin-29